jgi:hypothetical protein
MPKLPDFTDLSGVAPSAPRSMVDIPVPDIAGTARTVADAVGQVGTSIENVRKDREEKARKQERFDTKMGLLRAEEAYADRVKDLDPLDPEYVEKKRAARRETFSPVLSGVKDPENRMEFDLATQADYVELGIRAEGEHRGARRGKAKLDVASYYQNIEKQVASGNYKGDPVADLRAVVEDSTDLSDLDKLEIENDLIPRVALASVQRTATGLLDSGTALTPELRSAIDAVAKEPGMPTWMPEYLARTATMESSGGRKTVNPLNDGVLGVFQFDERTARDVGMLPEDRLDVGKSTAGAAKLALGRFNELKKNLGRDPTMSEVYLSHQQGAAGASKLLLNPDAPAASVIGEEAVTDNGGWEGMTAQQFVDFQELKFDGSDMPDDPDEIRELLATNPAFENLTPEGADAAVRYTVELGNAREREQREQVRLQRDEIYREFSDLDAAGGLTQEWIDTQKEAGIATPREIRIFENTFRNSKRNIPDDKDEVAAIVKQVNGASSDDDVNAAQIALDEAYAEGKVNNQTKARIAAGIKARRSAVKKQDEFVTRGEKIIARAVRSRDYSSGDLAEDEITEMAGKIAFQNWLEKNPSATELQIVTEAGKIAKQAAIDRVETVRASIDLPRGLTGWNRRGITREMLFAYAKGLQMQPPPPGREEEYLRDVELLKKWLEIIDIQDMAGGE